MDTAGTLVYSAADSAFLQNTSLIQDKREHSSSFAVFKNVNMDSSTIFECPNGGYPIEVQLKKIKVERISFLSASCGNKCPQGTFLFNNSYFRFNEKLNQIVKYNSNCTTCPIGGICDGSIVSAHGYWGYWQLNKLKFVTCPSSFCAERSTTYNSCSPHRTGTLCGDCEPGYSLSVTSSSCLPTGQCATTKKFVCEFLALAFACMATVAFLKEIIAAVKQAFVSCMNRLRCCNRQNQGGRDGARQNPKDPLFIGSIQMVINFYQLQSFLAVPMPQVQESVVRRFLSKVFSMDVISMAMCVPGMSTVLKQVLKTLFCVAVVCWLWLSYWILLAVIKVSLSSL